jgi:hypothetical protein
MKIMDKINWNELLWDGLDYKIDSPVTLFCKDKVVVHLFNTDGGEITLVADVGEFIYSKKEDKHHE